MNIVNPKKDFNPTDKLFVCVDKTSLVSQYSMQSDWQFRIYAQMLYRTEQCGYNIYFFTLTYKDKFLPKFQYNENSCPCFDSSIINKFCRSCQMDLLRYFNVTDYDYIVCDEFGKSHTFRPHHHVSFMVPDCVSPLAVHRIVKKNWSVVTTQYKKNGAPIREPYGWVLPDKIKGWKDKKGIQHSDFQVDKKNIDSCAIYLSKYCTKQIGWFMNPDVKKVFNELVGNKDYSCLKEFSKHKPRVKTSLHFGECINDWIMCKNVPSSVFVDKDYRYNLFYGIYTPLHRKTLTRIPFYNVRKLMWSKVEEYVEKVVNYCENEYYTYDIFTNFSTHNIKCNCPLTATDVFAGLRPLVEKKSLRYKWDVEISEFWRDYMPYEFEHKIKNLTSRFLDAKCWDKNSSFHKWLKDKLSPENYYLFNTYLNRVSATDLATYITAYHNRCSPLHLYAFLENPNLFKNGLIISEVNVITFDKYAKKSYNQLIEEYDYNYYNYVTTYVDKDVELDASIVEVQRPFFSGHESIEEMKCLALDFYLSKANYCSRSYYLTGKPDTYNVLFNSFPCFFGFDLVYNVINDYLHECNENRLKLIEDKFNKKQQLKNQVYAQSEEYL